MSAPPSSLPKRFPDRDSVGAVRAEAEGLEPGEEGAEARRLAGRVLGRRGHGKLVFLDLVDRSGQMQLLCAVDRSGPVDLDLGDIVGAVGKPTKSKRGEPSLAVDELVLLAKTGRPLPDTYHGLVDPETRYRKRYLDLLVNVDSHPAQGKGLGESVGAGWRKAAGAHQGEGQMAARPRAGARTALA